MFRYIYALRDGEELDPDSLRNQEFDGFEAASTDHGVELTGVQIAGLGARDLSDDLARAFSNGAKYVRLIESSPTPRTPRPKFAAMLDAYAPFEPDQRLLFPPSTSDSIRETWQITQLVTRPNVRVAWDAAASAPAWGKPAVIVPTLNLTLGLVRVSDSEATTLDFARRLAGIGFEGYFLVDPDPQEDRLGAARQIVEVVRDLLHPRKPAKAVAKKA